MGQLQHADDALIDEKLRTCAPVTMGAAESNGATNAENIGYTSDLNKERNCSAHRTAAADLRRGRTAAPQRRETLMRKRTVPHRRRDQRRNCVYHCRHD